MDLRQFKFIGGEEIICEVVNWNKEDEDTIVVRKALKIVAIEDIEDGLRYYTFKPWMSMHNDTELLSVVNSYHIIAENIPSEPAIESFNAIIEEMRQFGAEEDLESDIFTSDSDSNTNVVEFSKKLLH